MALLNPNHPTLRAQGIHLQSHPMSGKTINTILEGMATFAQWYDTELPGTSLRDVSQGDLDRFLAVLDQGATQNTRVCAVGAIRYRLFKVRGEGERRVAGVERPVVLL